MKYIVLLSIIFLSFNCKNKDREYIQTTIQEWTNKEIIFPDNVPAKILGRDTNCNYLLSKPIKILVYTDSSGCTACKLNFYDWQKKINSFAGTEDLGFLFYANTKNYKVFTNAIKGEDFNYPIFYDSHNLLASKNHFPKDHRFNVFLLNEENKVLLIGNPLGKENLWQLYTQLIDSLSISLKDNRKFHN